jgi:Alcohol dehydrogenase GroES-like domain
VIEVAGVCGSDISGFLGHSALRRPPLVLGHELVGRRRDGRRVVANPLVSCGYCDDCISGAQNLCESWTVLGLGTTPGTFANMWRCLAPKSTTFRILSVRSRRFSQNPSPTSSTCFGSSRPHHPSDWRSLAPGRSVRWLFPLYSALKRGMCGCRCQ